MSAPEHAPDLAYLDAILPTNGVAPTEVPADATGGFPIITAADLCQEPDPEEHELLGPIVYRGARTVIVGDTGEGKTTLALQIISAILTGTAFLNWHGKGEGKALIIDLEQGRKSVKRALREAQLDQRGDVDLVLVPDGLALDSKQEEQAELDRVIHAGQYTIVLLDPYYKAHRADDPNKERPIVDLMRQLDGLRALYEFALLLPAHPRKREVGATGPRKLTSHDISGSGAVTRGAEIIIGIERLNTGYARLRYLKDREGDLPIGEALGLIYNKQDGFQRDPKDLEPPKDYLQIVRQHSDGEWHTAKEYSDLCGSLAGEAAVKRALTRLVAENEYEFGQGIPGRAFNSKCWRPVGASDLRMHPDAPDAPGSFAKGKAAAASLHPPLVEGMRCDADAVPAAESDAPSSFGPPSDPDDDIPF